MPEVDSKAVMLSLWQQSGVKTDMYYVHIICTLNVTRLGMFWSHCKSCMIIEIRRTIAAQSWLAYVYIRHMHEGRVDRPGTCTCSDIDDRMRLG